MNFKKKEKQNCTGLFLGLQYKSIKIIGESECLLLKAITRKIATVTSSDCRQVKAGAVLNVCCVLIGTTGIHTLGWYIFDLSTLPWLNKMTSLAAASNTGFLDLVNGTTTATTLL